LTGSPEEQQRQVLRAPLALRAARKLDSPARCAEALISATQSHLTFPVSRTPLPLSTPSWAAPTSQAREDLTALLASVRPLSARSTASAAVFFTESSGAEFPLVLVLLVLGLPSSAIVSGVIWCHGLFYAVWTISTVSYRCHRRMCN
jgi:hypothetical protein